MHVIGSMPRAPRFPPTSPPETLFLADLLLRKRFSVLGKLGEVLSTLHPEHSNAQGAIIRDTSRGRGRVGEISMCVLRRFTATCVRVRLGLKVGSAFG